MNNKEHFPMYGIGSIYGAAIITVTGKFRAGVNLKNMEKPVVAEIEDRMQQTMSGFCH